MLSPGNYIQWKSKIKRYINTKPNNELIKWTEKAVPVAEGSTKTTTEGYMENYKNVSQDIRDQLNAEAEAVQIILEFYKRGWRWRKVVLCLVANLSFDIRGDELLSAAMGARKVSMVMIWFLRISNSDELATSEQGCYIVAFGGSARGGKITGKGKIRTYKLDFEDVFFVKELKFNLFSVSQMCDKKNSVFFTETECLVLSLDFKLLVESQVLLRVPRQSNMYNFDLKNVVPSGDLTCLFEKAIIDESKLWHRRLGHINFKTMNKLVKENLIRGLPSKIFDNDYTCVACQKGKQYKASCKAKLMSSISQPLQMLHMDLFGPTYVRSINHKTYCLVVTDDFCRFSWVLFLASKDETSGILKRFITEIENLVCA
ncbi:putative ribonuclease H-like domain-containing protein [Tanacetum coccineum]